MQHDCLLLLCVCASVRQIVFSADAGHSILRYPTLSGVGEALYRFSHLFSAPGEMFGELYYMQSRLLVS